jgi:type IV pilus assembly protein PilP
LLAEGSVRIFATAVVLVMLAMTGCDNGNNAGPTTSEFSQRRQALAQRLAKKKQSPKAAAPAQPAADFDAGSGLIATGLLYDPAGKRDPFRSFLLEKVESAEDVVRGPLEQYDVSQLSLVAVIWSTGNARALVQDPSGESFVIAEGTPIGKNSGRVIRIDDNLVVVKETYVDFLGEETKRDIEMRIRTSEGG